MGDETKTRRRGKALVYLAVVLALAGALGYGVWRWLSATKEPDMQVVFRENNRGVGLMDQFQYDKAAAVFEDVVALAPDWLPGKINLGIALLNVNKADVFPRARRIFDEVLAKEPDNPYAHFCLGIVMNYQGKPTEAADTVGHFEKVIDRDPDDAAAWYWLGKSLYDDRTRARKCFQRALRLDPHLSAAYHNLRPLLLEAGDAAAAEAALEETRRLRIPGDDGDTYGNVIDVKYGQMGRYGNVIYSRPPSSAGPRTGPLPVFHRDDKLQIKLAEGAAWATSSDLGKDEIGKLRARARARFGAVMVVLDYNGDGKPDLFLVSAVVDKKTGKVRDLLLRNDGGGIFTDVTAAAGLASPRPSLGCCVADFDNDGKPDLLITGAGEQHLFRNTGRGFEDVSARAGLDQLKTICLGAAFIDLDQDGDLDLVIAQYAALDQAGKVFQGKETPAGGGLALFLNIGEALPVRVPAASPPLTTRFRRVTTAKDIDGKSPRAFLGASIPTVNVTASDLDDDNDLDMLVLADDHAAELILNDRRLQAHRLVLPEAAIPRALWNGALVLDVNRSGRSDVLLVGPARAPILLLNRPGGAGKTAAKWFETGTLKGPALIQAAAIDLDLDGWTDVVGLSVKRVPVLLHNMGGRLVEAPEALGSDRGWPADLAAVTVADFTGDGYPDLMVWSERKGLELHVNQGNGNKGLQIVLSGQRRIESNANRKLRCNADGLGTKVTAQAGSHWTSVEHATRSAGLGQSSQPLVLGLGRANEADVVRLLWPDNTLQAELNVPAGQVTRVEQKDRRTGSCPVLFTWNGERFVFVTDFLGAGSMGESLPEGGYRMPWPEESVKIEPEQLRPKDGEYVLKIAEPMDEVTYLDRLQLVAIDHPAEVVIYPDERFLDAATPPSQELLAFEISRRIFPEKATDQRGHDVTHALLEWDRHTVDGFAKRSWIGLAEEHWVKLDFGTRLARLTAKDRVFLCMAGWTDYPYPESMWAARQAGISVVPPVLERLLDDGKSWEPVATGTGQPVDLGFPAGLPRMMTFEVTGLIGKHSKKPLCGVHCVLRLRTNMEVYWDQVFLAPLHESAEKNRKSTIGIRKLEVCHADLSARGLMQEYSPDGKAPTLYDYDRVDRVPVSRLSGRLTRYGQVTELLRDRDDHFAIFGPGDVLTVRFDARRSPALPSGWKRSFVLRTWGYCKDAAPFTATGDTVEPLPFRKMSRYPYGPREHYPRDAAHKAYRSEYNTRQMGPRPK